MFLFFFYFYFAVLSLLFSLNICDCLLRLILYVCRDRIAVVRNTDKFNSEFKNFKFRLFQIFFSRWLLESRPLWVPHILKNWFRVLIKKPQG